MKCCCVESHSLQHFCDSQIRYIFHTHSVPIPTQHPVRTNRRIASPVFFITQRCHIEIINSNLFYRRNGRSRYCFSYSGRCLANAFTSAVYSQKCWSNLITQKYRETRESTSAHRLEARGFARYYFLWGMSIFPTDALSKWGRVLPINVFKYKTFLRVLIG